MNIVLLWRILVTFDLGVACIVTWLCEKEGGVQNYYQFVPSAQISLRQCLTIGRFMFTAWRPTEQCKWCLQHSGSGHAESPLLLGMMIQRGIWTSYEGPRGTLIRRDVSSWRVGGMGVSSSMMCHTSLITVCVIVASFLHKPMRYAPPPHWNLR